VPHSFTLLMLIAGLMYLLTRFHGPTAYARCPACHTTDDGEHASDCPFNR
jgi:hypothetical protein